MIIKLKFSKIQRSVKKNLEFTFLLVAIIITIFSVRIYNVNKNVINQNYINLINNTYFQKSISHVFDNLKPKFLNIKHKVSKGETFNNILNLGMEKKVWGNVLKMEVIEDGKKKEYQYAVVQDWVQYPLKDPTRFLKVNWTSFIDFIKSRQQITE